MPVFKYSRADNILVFKNLIRQLDKDFKNKNITLRRFTFCSEDTFLKWKKGICYLSDDRMESLIDQIYGIADKLKIYGKQKTTEQ